MASNTARPKLREKLIGLFTDRRMAVVFSQGFYSGLPLLLTISTLQAWFSDAQIGIKEIGALTLVGMPYTLKFLWSPIFDRFVPPFLGRRRGWMLITQFGLVLALIGISFCDPTSSLGPISFFAILIAFASASQDITIDAYRREYLPAESFGFGFSLAITGYRIGMIVAGSGALMLADTTSWPNVYRVMALIMAIGAVITFLCPEPQVKHDPPKSIRAAYVDPFVDFFTKPQALWILAFILLYKIGDNFATSLTTPFYLKLGYTKTQIGAIAKVFAIWSTIIGGMIGGAAMAFLGMRRSLWIFGILQGSANLSFAALAALVPLGAAQETAFSTAALAGAVTIENLTAGMGTAAYTAFMASMTNRRFTATQYALLSSLMGVPRVMVGVPAGWMAERLPWELFFIICTLLSIPGLLILFKVGKIAEEAEAQN
jgi:PAT family beta-lactamase induction signal transducer AmpG